MRRKVMIYHTEDKDDLRIAVRITKTNNNLSSKLMLLPNPLFLPTRLLGLPRSNHAPLSIILIKVSSYNIISYMLITIYHSV